MTGKTQYILSDDRIRQIAQGLTQTMAQDGRLLFPENALLEHRNRIESRAQSLGAAVTAKDCELMVLACYSRFSSTSGKDTVEMNRLVDAFLTDPEVKRRRKKLFPHRVEAL